MPVPDGAVLIFRSKSEFFKSESTEKVLEMMKNVLKDINSTASTPWKWIAKRVIQKLDAEAPHEIMLVLDASIGQNALHQAREFHQAIGLTGITMTKLDGTAKGGILFAIANELAIPFRYIGIGENIDDLRPFDSQQFVRAIFNDD